MMMASPCTGINGCPYIDPVMMAKVFGLWLGLATVSPTAGFMYRPSAGLTWDPSCLVHNGTTYCYFM
jgi:hypothetical protein